MYIVRELGCVATSLTKINVTPVVIGGSSIPLSELSVNGGFSALILYFAKTDSRYPAIVALIFKVPVLALGINS